VRSCIILFSFLFALLVVHHPYETFNRIADIAEGPCLSSISVNDNGDTVQCVHNTITDNTSVIGSHTGAVSIKNACHFDIHLILSQIIEKECFCDPLPFVIAGPLADRVNIPPIFLSLGMLLGIPVNFTC
jgi:hypothetical protein